VEVKQYVRYLQLLGDVAVTGEEAAKLCRRVTSDLLGD